MSLKLMYITNDANIAKMAERSGVDWVFVDLEINGKEERQGHLDTVISRHSIGDVAKIKSVLTQAKLLVRINPVFSGSKQEIDHVIRGGADIIMLPHFKSAEEARTFIRYIAGRVKTCLLVETSGAVENIDSILRVPGIDYLYIGLNDLHLSYKKKFMFELLTDGTVEHLCNKFKKAGIPYGFGGIARIGKGDLPAEYIIAEHYRLGSGMTILSRSFGGSDHIKEMDSFPAIFRKGVEDIRLFESQIRGESSDFFESNYQIICQKIDAIIKGLSDESAEKQ